MAFEAETKEFTDKIKQNEIFINYKKARKALATNPELLAQVDDYRRKRFEMQSITSGEELYDKVDAFEREFAAWKEQPLVSNYLDAELAVCRLMQGISLSMVNELEFDW